MVIYILQEINKIVFSHNIFKMNYLNLVRYKNLILIAFMQLLFCFGFLKLQNVDLALANFQYYLLVLSTVLIAAGGYVINNIFDQETDLENDKEVVVGKSISEKSAYNMYFVLNLIGVGIAFYLSQIIQRPNFVVFFILIVTILYFYATTLKQLPLIGNIAVAFILSFSIIIIGIYQLLPATDEMNKVQMRTLFSILFDFAIITFIINLIREIVKDLEDFKGDNSQGMRTLSIILGIEKTTKLIAFLLVVPIVLILLYINNYLMENKLYYATVYILITIIAPLTYVLVKIVTAKIKSEFHHLSTVLKIVLFFGIVTIVVISQNIIHNG